MSSSLLFLYTCSNFLLYTWHCRDVSDTRECVFCLWRIFILVPTKQLCPGWWLWLCLALVLYFARMLMMAGVASQGLLTWWDFVYKLSLLHIWPGLNFRLCLHLSRVVFNCGVLTSKGFSLGVACPGYFLSQMDSQSIRSCETGLFTFAGLDLSCPPTLLLLVAFLDSQPCSGRSRLHAGWRCPVQTGASSLVLFFRNSSHFQCPDSGLCLLILVGLTSSAWSYLAVLQLGNYPWRASEFPYPSDCTYTMIVLVLLIKCEP